MSGPGRLRASPPDGALRVSTTLDLPSGFGALHGRALDLLGEPGRRRIVVAILCAVALYMWRSGDGITRPQLWAEDGRVFFSEARTFGLASIVTPYAGYLHVVQRVVALACSPFTAVLAPEFYAASSVLIVAWIAATVAACADRHAWLLAAVMMAVPVGGEIFGTLTNVQWFGQVGLAAVVATSTPASRAARLGQIAFALAFVLDGPFSIFAAPLAAWRTWTDRRDAHALAIGSIVIAGALVQLRLALGEASPYEGVREPWHLAAMMMDRWIGQSAHPGLTLRAPAVRADIALAVALLGSLTACGPLARRLLLYAGLSLAATYTRFVPDSRYFDGAFTGERYFYLPRLALLWCFLSCAVRLRRTSVFGLLGLVLMGLSFDHWVRQPLPKLPWRTPAREIDRGGAVDIVINPTDPANPGPYPWTVSLPERR